MIKVILLNLKFADAFTDADNLKVEEVKLRSFWDKID
jgi:hypothetical protein